MELKIGWREIYIVNVIGYDIFAARKFWAHLKRSFSVRLLWNLARTRNSLVHIWLSNYVGWCHQKVLLGAIFGLDNLKKTQRHTNLIRLKNQHIKFKVKRFAIYWKIVLSFLHKLFLWSRCLCSEFFRKFRQSHQK